MLASKGRNWRNLGNLEEDEHTHISRTADKKKISDFWFSGVLVFGLVVESIDKPFHQ